MKVKVAAQPVAAPPKKELTTARSLLTDFNEVNLDIDSRR